MTSEGCIQQGEYVYCNECPRVTCVYAEPFDSEVSEDDWAENSQETS